MSLNPADIRAAAAQLHEAERARLQIPLLSDAYPNLDMDDAYAIQAEWVRRKCAEGDSIFGWKIGLTSKAMQTQLLIDTPDSGVLLRSMVFQSGETIPKGRFIQPRVESEVAFVLKSPLAKARVTAQDVLAAIDYVVPALEILDTRVVRKDANTGRIRTVLDTISDNAANAGVVVGEPIRDLRNLDLRWMGAIVSRDGEVEETGLGAGVLNDPALSVAWLAERLFRYGNAIEAGQLVLSGSFIRAIEAPPGCAICADFGPFGRVECQFE